MLLIITSTGDRLFGFINIDDLERPCTLKILILSDFLAIFGCKRVNCDEMDGETTITCEQELLSAFARLMNFAQITCNFNSTDTIAKTGRPSRS